MSNAPIDRLIRLLEAEKTALLAGDFEAVGAMIPEKEALAQSFEQSDSGALSILADTLARNGVLLAAAKDGVSTVVQTMRQQRDARRTLSSYDKNGNATQISQPTRATERRF